MVQTALGWLFLNAVLAGFAAVAVAAHYADEGEPDFVSAALAAVFAGTCVELGTANGYLPDGVLPTAVVGVCVVVALVSFALGVRRDQTAFQAFRGGARSR
ncbi:MULTISPECIES: hypothetical protein [Haloferax]|jgi:uncharacterized membrane protein YfcA|uniref:Uncharacterized protein n=4 Tax=Haloferax TaxID=2251 RepID=A0A6C0UXZ4_HALVO|nr:MULTISPECIES: hypothetical protein [Haloferax]ELK48417.1 hypothetical protein D320_19682 [Haloferax sp. BAB-2207]ELZ76113.1 hypothetical protein C456_04775 [Haloferax lucentense DSM 14919]ELZ86824.1 hypothetical protein C452_16240 [Haloferax alexandrinus JCM 10717]NLV04052.1 hypothetical protein [Haloferax alexandrinus]QIB79453.1 hypothetical protein G3A49_15590 [Haloferax alexandrinus]